MNHEELIQRINLFLRDLPYAREKNVRTVTVSLLNEVVEALHQSRDARLESLPAGGDAEELANQLDVISNRELRADHRQPWQDVTAKGADMLRSQAGQIAALREALIRMVKYADWQIAEGVDHHPTLPSAIEEARALLAGAGD